MYGMVPNTYKATSTMSIFFFVKLGDNRFSVVLLSHHPKNIQYDSLGLNLIAF